jgi:Probable Zinc-ribbon domain
MEQEEARMSHDLKTRSFAMVRPDLAREWDVEKNGDLTPDAVTAGSHRKVWWKCGNGHEWLAEVKSRVHGNGCPFCAGQKVGKDNSLAIRFPELIAEWHTRKNRGLTPDKVMPGSDRKVWWICSKGHEWTATIGNRTRGNGCPFCSGRYATEESNLALANPELAHEWHPEKNGDLTPLDVLPHSNKNVWWKCEKGHEWLARPNDRMRGYGCPYCYGRLATPDNNLAVRNPGLAAEWDVEKNGDLTTCDVLPNTSKKVWWKCGKGHRSYLASPNRRTNGGTGCPECAGKVLNEDNNLAARFPELVSEWDLEKNGGLTPYNVMPGSDKKAWWKCSKGHDSYLSSPNSRTSAGTGCPLCKMQTSKPEFRLFCELAFVFSDAEWQKKIGKDKCDIYVPSHNFAIEYDGVYWHRNRTNEDRKKGERLNKRGIILFRLREYGLDAVSDLDVVKRPRDSFLDSIKRLLLRLSDYIHMSPDESSKCQIYGNSSEFINTEEYSKMVHTLSIPRFKNSVAAHPVLSQEWDNDRNDGRKPYMFALGSGEMIWWKCSKGHNWQATINQRKGGNTGCPECAGQRVGKDNNLAVRFPELVSQWNFEKNGDLLPDHVMSGSSRKVWWKCNTGHEWQATIGSRVRGNGCPFCSGRFVTEDNNLAIRFPELVAEWNAEKNGALRPDKVMPGSSRKVWWKCGKGHEWLAVVSSRASGTGCPECAGQKVGEDNNLAVRSPELVAEWHSAKNVGLTPDRVMPGSDRKVWWKCGKSHEWEATISSRMAGNGCPACNRERQRTRRRATDENNLAVTNPDLFLEWHPVRNENLTPNDVMPGSHRKVWWKCGKGHEWSAAVRSRARGNGCPMCAGQVATADDNLLVKYPLIAEEWHPTLKGELLPSKVKSQSGKKVWWKCNEGHEWKARIQDRVRRGTSCPHCAREKRPHSKIL